MTYRRNDGDDWDDVFEVQRDRFLIAACALLSCRTCATTIIEEAHSLVRDARIATDFRYKFAMRAVVRLAISHRLECSVNTSGARPCDHRDVAPTGYAPLEPLPFLERAVYFLRDILGYSRRETSLMMGMHDSHVDQLLRVAQARIGAENGSSNSPREWYRQKLLQCDATQMHPTGYELPPVA